MLSQIGHLLVQTAFGIVVYALLLRFHMQWLRAPFRNPVGQFVSALTDWIVRPVRRFVPGLFGLDLATILIAWFAEALMLVLLYRLRGFPLAGSPGAAGLLFTLAAMELLRASLYLMIGVIIVQVIISWVNPHAPLAPVFDALTRPFYAVFRRFVPTLGNVDLSPLFVLLVAQILLILLDSLVQLLPGGG
jgi:YggT family protein